MKCGIIGAGLSGLACADGLRAAGHDVVLFDKGRFPGGRMSSRRLRTAHGETWVDHGAPWFEVRDAEFAQAVAAWARAGLVTPWPEAGPNTWIGVPRMSVVLAHLAAPHDVAWSTFAHGFLKERDGSWRIVTDHGAQGPFDIVVVATPPEQAAPILSLHDLAMARSASTAASRACWAGLFVFARSLPVPSGPRRGADVIALATCNRSKPSRSGPEAWVVHAAPGWSAAHLEHRPADVAPMLLAALMQLLGLGAWPACEGSAHRWRYASSPGLGRSALWNAELGLGACGDWLMGPHAECAWISGQALARQIIAAVPAHRLRAASSA